MAIHYILDTDHVSLYQQRHRAVEAKVNQIGLDAIAVTAITVEEQAQGWLSAIRKASAQVGPAQATKLAWVYAGLRSSVQFLSRFQILDYTEAAHDRVLSLRQQGLRVGTQDLRIAGVALVAGLVVVTRNGQDFGQVAELGREDWTG